MIRALVERLPVMITPRWVNTAAQPIAIEDVIEYLAAATRLPLRGEPHGRNRRERRYFVRRDHARIRPAAEIAALDRARAVPQFVVVEPLADADHAGLCIHRAVPHRERAESERGADPKRPWSCLTSGPWGSRGRSSGPWRTRIGPLRRPAGPTRARSRGWTVRPEPGRDLLINEQTIRVPLASDQAFAPIRRIGGRTGWYFGNMLWRIRGLIDLMMGGVGMRRGPARSRDSASGKHVGFLARGDLRARPAAAAVCGDESPRARLARVPRGTRGRFDGDPADRAVRTARAGRAPVLVSAVARPRSDVPRNAAAHCRRGTEPEWGT